MRGAGGIVLISLWVLWFAPYLFLAPKVQKRRSVTARGPSLAGLVLEALGIAMLWAFPARDAPRIGWAFVCAVAVGVISAVGMWQAIVHLGRQFRIQAGLYEDHRLVRTGPYAMVRHPIYASLLGMTLSTGLVFTRWEILPVAIVLFLVGTEIRVGAEDRLLASRFGKEFADYRSRVRAYVPYVR